VNAQFHVGGGRLAWRGQKLKTGLASLTNTEAAVARLVAEGNILTLLGHRFSRAKDGIRTRAFVHPVSTTSTPSAAVVEPPTVWPTPSLTNEIHDRPQRISF